MMTTVQIAGTAAPSSFAKSAALGSAAPCAAGGVCLALPTSKIQQQKINEKCFPVCLATA